MVDVPGISPAPFAGGASKAEKYETVDLTTAYGALRLMESIPFLTMDEAKHLQGSLETLSNVKLPSHVEILRRINEEGIGAVVAKARGQLKMNQGFHKPEK